MKGAIMIGKGITSKKCYHMERQTWDEIVSRYPDMALGLTDVKFLNDDGINIESAVVSYTDKNTSINELQNMAIGGKIFLARTTLIPDMAVGVIE